MSLNKVLDVYDNVIGMGDINIDTLDNQKPGYISLKVFCDVFGPSNIVTCNTCFTRQKHSSIGVILTNKPRDFQAVSIFNTGLSDCHGLVASTMSFIFIGLDVRKLSTITAKILIIRGSE